MAEGGAESVTIAGVTEHADVAQGTFYNYFASREAVIDAVVHDNVETLGQRLDALTRDLSDAAEIYSFSLRHLIGTAVSDPTWGWVMVRLGIAHEALLQALGPRATRDLQIGVDAGRFQLPDVPLAAAMTFGALLSAMRAHLAGLGPADPATPYAEYLLRMAGIPPEEAAEIVRRPLPALPALG